MTSSTTDILAAIRNDLKIKADEEAERAASAFSAESDLCHTSAARAYRTAAETVMRYELAEIRARPR